jgi:signal peptidase I
MKRALAWLFIFLAFLVGVLLALRLFVFDLAQSVGDDMRPTLGRGAWLVVNRLAEPRRGDLIMMRRGDSEAFLVRRVVALPGERIAVVGGRPVVGTHEARQDDVRPIAIAGRMLTEMRETLDDRSWRVLVDKAQARKDLSEQRVDGYFVMADNRDHGADSRDFGIVPRVRIRGVVFVKLSGGEGP